MQCFSKIAQCYTKIAQCSAKIAQCFISAQTAFYVSQNIALEFVSQYETNLEYKMHLRPQVTFSFFVLLLQYLQKI